MSANSDKRYAFDPYKRPPAARLLAVLTIGLALAWLMQRGDASQVAQFHRDPAKYAARMDRIGHHGFGFSLVVSLMVVTVIVFAVEGLSSLFSRWLTERDHPGNGLAPPGPSNSARAEALLGHSTPPPPEA